MGNTQSSQPKGDQAVLSNTLYNPQTGQTTDLNSGKIYTSKIGVNPQQQAIVGTVINCPVGQTLTAVCTSNTNVKQGFEGFESTGFRLTNLTIALICFIILIYAISIYFAFYHK